MTTTSQDADMLRENIDSGVKAVVKIEAKWKAMCAIDTSSAYTETYFRETNDDSVDGGSGSPIKGLQPMSPFKISLSNSMLNFSASSNLFSLINLKNSLSNSLCLISLASFSFLISSNLSSCSS